MHCFFVSAEIAARLHVCVAVRSEGAMDIVHIFGIFVHKYLGKVNGICTVILSLNGSTPVFVCVYVFCFGAFSTPPQAWLQLCCVKCFTDIDLLRVTIQI